MASTLKINNIDTASGTTITIPTGKQLIVTDEGAVRVPGTVLQVQQAYARGGVTANSTTFVASGIDIDFTPKYATSKVLIQATGCYDTDAAARQMYAVIYRDSTRLDTITDSGSAGLASAWNNGERQISNFNIMFLDSPSTTSQIHYELYHKSGSSFTTEMGSQNVRSTITCMEIAQ